MSYTKADHERVAESLHQVHAAADDALAALAAGDAEAALGAIGRAGSERSAAASSFPSLVVNEALSLRFDAIYPDFYDIDLLIIIGLQWPDAAPSSMTAMEEVIDGFAEKLTDLRTLRALEWAPREDQALAGLDELIAKSEQLQIALKDVSASSRLDPRRFGWLGHELKAQFLNGVGELELLGEMYGFLFSTHHALEHARWSVEHRKMHGATRRLVEAQRVNGLLLNWLEEHEPAS